MKISKSQHEDINNASDKLLCSAGELFELLESEEKLDINLYQIQNLYRYAKFAYEYAEMVKNVLEELQCKI